MLKSAFGGRSEVGTGCVETSGKLVIPTKRRLKAPDLSSSYLVQPWVLISSAASVAGLRRKRASANAGAITVTLPGRAIGVRGMGVDLCGGLAGHWAALWGKRPRELS